MTSRLLEKEECLNIFRINYNTYTLKNEIMTSEMENFSIAPLRDELADSQCIWYSRED